MLLGDPRVDPNSMDFAGDTPILMSVKATGYRYGSHDVHETIRLLLVCRRVDLNARDSGGRTTLSYVVATLTCLQSFHCRRGVDSDLVESLLEQGADPSIKDNEKKTPLDWLDWALSVNVEGSDKCRELLRKCMPAPPQADEAVNTSNKRKTPPLDNSIPPKSRRLE